MATDRSLATLLRALQSGPTSFDDASRLLSTAATLLSLLTNPLNITLLTTKLLTAPAIWSFQTANLHVPLQVLRAFHTATWHVRTSQNTRDGSPLGVSTNIAADFEQWTRAIIAGANEKCERWKHSLVLGGVLIGLTQQRDSRTGSRLEADLSSAIVTATNLALDDAATEAGGDLAEQTLCVVLGHCFDLLSDSDKLKLQAERLVPILPRAMFFSRDGLRHGYFLGMLDTDVVQKSRDKFDWSAKSASFREVQRMASGPIVSTLGTLSRLTAFCLERMRSFQLLAGLSDDLTAFSRSLCVQWRQTKLSEVAESEESMFLGEETLQVTLPLLWQVLKSAMFSVVVIQSAIMGLILGDLRLSQRQASPVAAQTLQSLRNLYFTISRIGHSSLSQLTFVYMSSIDILARDSRQAEVFLQQIRPGEFGRIPSHPHERCFDLFYLNTAEHLALSLSSTANEELLSAATPYLVVGGDPRLIEIFEAAHSVVLSVFCAPQNSALMSHQLPFYVNTLLHTFPQTLSSHQFRLAIRTVVRLVSPPSPVAVTDPLLASTILELLRSRAAVATTVPLPSDGRSAAGPHLTEQTVLALALLDCLPLLPPGLMREWLPLAAAMVDGVVGNEALGACRAHFWDVLSGDAMVGARGETAVYWWTTEGGQSSVFNPAKTLSGKTAEEPTMSGALEEGSRL